MKSHLQPARAFLSEYPEHKKEDQVPFSDNVNQVLGTQNPEGKLDGYIFFLQEQRMTFGEANREKFMVPYKIATYENGVLHGPTVQFQQESGKMILDEKGNFVKDMVYFYDHGKVSATEMYNNGKLVERMTKPDIETSQTLKYNLSGDTIEEINFKGNKLNGGYFSRSIAHFMLGAFEDDLKQGVWKVDDKSSGLKYETHFSKGLKNGHSVEHTKEGWVFGEYSKGSKEGAFFHLDESTMTSSKAVLYYNDEPKFFLKFDPMTMDALRDGSTGNLSVHEIGTIVDGQEIAAKKVTKSAQLAVKELNVSAIQEMVPN